MNNHKLTLFPTIDLFEEEQHETPWSPHRQKHDIFFFFFLDGKQFRKAIGSSAREYGRIARVHILEGSKTSHGVAMLIVV